MIPMTTAMTNVFNSTTKAMLGLMIYLDFDPAKGSGGGPVRLTTFPFPQLTWTPPAGYSGTVWFGLARIQGLGELRWSSDAANTPMALVLGAVDSNRLNDAFNASRLRFCTMWLAAYTTGVATPGIVADPISILKRRMYPASAASSTLTVEIGLESLFNRTRNRAVKKRSDADQRVIDAGDASLQDASQGTLGNDAQNWVPRSGF